MLLKALLMFCLFPFCISRDIIRWNEEQVKDGDHLVSKGSNFELGFFSPGNSSYRYVGIWYSMSKISEQTVVWVANRNNPINDTSGVLTISRYGELVIYAHNMERTPIWSTNMSQLVQNASSLSAQLLDTGNLVLFQDDQNEIFTWQSFDHLTDTLIPGMKVGKNWKTGLEWYLTSWKSQDDPGTGDYTDRLYSTQTAIPQFFLYKGPNPYWRSDYGPHFVSNQDETYYFLVDNTSTISRVKLNYSGILQRLTWNDAKHQWQELWEGPTYPCEWYGHCGANSKCSPDNMNLFECECLPGYEPKSVNDWNQRNGSDGCTSKRVEVSKCGNGEGFVEVAKVKEPDASKGARLESAMSAKECKQQCLRNCSCTAYMSIDIEGLIDCLTWYSDLLDIKVHTAVVRDLYVRVDNIELAQNARKSKGFFRRRAMLTVPIVSVLLPLVLVSVFTCWRLKRKTKDFTEAAELEETTRHPELQFFDLNTLIAATENFSPDNKIRQGGFGSVYKV